MSGVEYQSCGNCWAHAATGVAEGLLHNYIGYNAGIDLDEMQITNNSSCGDCDGVAEDDAECGLIYIYSNKVRSEQGLNSFPNYDQAYYTISSYSDNTASINAIKAALQSSPVLAGMSVYVDFQNFSGTGVYQHTSGSYVSGHAVVIVSYNEDDEYWICKNSWGTNWGNNGYFKIKFGECGIDAIANVNATVTSSSCIAKLIPIFFSFNDAMNGSYGSNEWAYLLSNTTFSSSNSIPSSARLIIYSGISFTINGGTFTVNGALSANSAITLNNSSGFTINGSFFSNSTVTCSSNASMLVAGTVSGATFQGNGTLGSWSGIQMNSGTFTGNVIKDAVNGVSINSNNVLFQANIIRNCNTDIFFNNTGGSIPLVRDNRIYENPTGISCYGYTYPLIFPCNKIYDNGTNITISSSSAPDFGRYADQGHNSIYWGTPYDIYSNYAGTIYACYCWWGSYPPYPYLYGTVDYSNALNYDPNPLILNIPHQESVPVVSKKMTGSKISQKNEIPGLKEVDKTRGLFSQGKYAEALGTFETILNNYSDYLSGEISLFFIDECLNKLNRESERAQNLDDIIKNKGKKNISGIAQMIQRKYLIKEGKYNEVISNALSSKTDFPNSQFEIYSLYDLGSLYWYYLGDKKTGENYYRELIKIYPDDPLADAALAALGEWKPKGKEVEKSASMTKAESSEILEQNFPNPFNPSTKITYNVPKDGKVRLSIYDILGKEISTLVNEEKVKGKYSVGFNSDRLSSGTYFYRVVITPSNGEKEIMQQRAMQIIK